MHLHIFGHEIYHVSTKECGDVRNRIRNSTMEIAELFLKPESEEKNTDAIVQLELANLILHKKSQNIQEALAAYVIHLYQQIPSPPITDEELEKAGSKKDELTANKDLEISQQAAKSLKNVILSNSIVKKIFDDFIWLSKTFRDDLMPVSVAQFGLDLRYDIHPNLVIISDPVTDVEWRFNMVIESLKSLDKKGKLNLVPRFSETTSRSRMQREDIKFDYFLGQLTGLEAGIIDLLTNGLDKHVQEIQFRPSEVQINVDSKFKPMDLTLVDNPSLQFLFEFAKRNIWTGFKMRGEILLIPNTRFVPDEILSYWFTYFSYWFLKECIIGDEDIDSKIELLPQLKDQSGIFKEIQMAKTIQKTLEFDKSEYFEQYKKMRDEANS